MRTSSNRGNTVLMWVAGSVILHGLSGGISAASGSPDNAALLYYQACMNRCGLTLPWGVGKVLDGGDPGQEMRELLSGEKYRLVIDLTMAATRIPECDWGLWVSGHWSPGGIPVSYTHLRAHET